MPDARPEVLEFLLTRRSRPAKTLVPPAPEGEALRRLLTAAARSPDHGKLVPWRFVVLRGAALARLAGLAEARGRALGLPEGDIEKARNAFANAPLIVTVVSAPRNDPKIPRIEQQLSAGCVCLGLLNAALAAGWGANWLTGWPAHDRGFCAALGLSEAESVAGFIHLGTATVTPPDRERPDIDRITSWIEA
ncbi:MAG: nitroreductase [Paracoccaceae bacterium]|nr:MAG: nitroreductase [Alphaproteobacteria bacterium]GIX12358.1 MAG: nitroreductase [Paracoccaceae bacterium]